MALPSMALGGFSQIAQLIQDDPDALATKAAEAGLLPPGLEALGAVKAPAAQRAALPGAIAPPRTQAIASTIPDITGLLAPQQPAQPAGLGQLILGGR